MSGSYLLTGGAGFIGSHLAQALVERGDHVVVLDDLSTGDLGNLDPIADHKNFRFVHGSVLDELMVDDLVHRCDVVVHLAAATGVWLVVEQPLRSLIHNIRASQIVIGAAFRHRRQLMLTGSSEVYGKNGDVPLKEDANRVLGPPRVARWAYSTGKAIEEILAYAYHKERGLQATVVRLFSTVGPRQRPGNGAVMARLVRQAVAGQPLTVFGDGSQTRCFCHVADVVDCLLRLLDHPDALGQVFNVGTQEEISIQGLAGRIRDLAADASGNGKSVPVEFIPYEQAYPSGFEDMPRRVPDTTRVRALTGWQPTRTLDDILTEMIGEASAEPEGVTARQV